MPVYVENHWHNNIYYQRQDFDATLLFTRQWARIYLSINPLFSSGLIAYELIAYELIVYELIAYELIANEW